MLQVYKLKQKESNIEGEKKRSVGYRPEGKAVIRNQPYIQSFEMNGNCINQEGSSSYFRDQLGWGQPIIMMYIFHYSSRLVRVRSRAIQGYNLIKDRTKGLGGGRLFTTATLLLATDGPQPSSQSPATPLLTFHTNTESFNYRTRNFVDFISLLKTKWPCVHPARFTSITNSLFPKCSRAIRFGG